MLESVVEKHLKNRLESRGWKVLKLYTPGSTGSADRLILRPTYWPGPPYIIEVKAPGKRPRALQEAKFWDWAKRGVSVIRHISTIAEADYVVDTLFAESYMAYLEALDRLP